MTVKFVPNDKGNPAGKLADAELHFSGGPLDGLKLIGFAIWERRGGARNVTVRPPFLRSQTANPMSFRPSSGPPEKVSSASASFPGGLPLSFGTNVTVMFSASCVFAMFGLL